MDHIPVRSHLRRRPLALRADRREQSWGNAPEDDHSRPGELEKLAFSFPSGAGPPRDPDQGSERAYPEWFLFKKTANPAATYTDADLAEYERCFRQTGNLRGALAYYRAVYDNMAHNAELRSDVGDRSGIRVSAQPSSRRSAL